MLVHQRVNAVIFSPERQDQEPWPCHPVVKPIWGMWSTHTATMTTSVPQAAASQWGTCFACSGGSHWSRLVPSFWGKMSGKELVSVAPSGELTKSYWKWPFIVDFPIKNGDFPWQNVSSPGRVEGLQISPPGGSSVAIWEQIQSWWMIIQFHQESATNPAEPTFAVTSPASIISIACWTSAFAWMCCPIQKNIVYQ